MSSSRPAPPANVIAMLSAGAVTMQYVGSKATRDALFLAQFDPTTALPWMVAATALFSIVLVAANSKAVATISPARLVPALFAASAVMLLVEWAMLGTYPRGTAIIAYLHISGIGPILGSGFWLILSERFDPRTAKRRFGQISGVGTLFGGALGVALLLLKSLDVAVMLPTLAFISMLCAWVVWRLAAPLTSAGPAVGQFPDFATAPARSGIRVLVETPYLRHLAALVLLGTTSAALIDYVLKVEAKTAFAGDDRLRFFGAYYGATSLLAFVVQVSASRAMLERFGLALTTSMPSLALVGGGIIASFVPGLRTIVGIRGTETVVRSALFRPGYELFFTPIPPAEKRAAKSIIDVGFDRLGDLVGAGMLQSIMMMPLPASQYRSIMGLCIACSLVAVVVASRLNRGYIQTLEHSLLHRAVEVDLSEVEDGTTRTLLLRTIERQRVTGAARAATAAPAPREARRAAPIADPELQEIAELRSHDRERIVAILRRDEGLPAPLVTHAIALLAWDPVAADAVFALTKVAEDHVGALIDALLDPNQEFAVRRRLARVFSVCVSQRAADGLMLGLDDQRFEVRYHCGRSLAAILDKNPLVRVDRERVFDVVRHEVAVSRSVWESRRLLDRWETGPTESAVDTFVRDRASQGLSHVFTLLSLVLPREPLQIAFRSLFTEDQNLRGTALEYLEGVLPAAIRDRLWPFLEDRRPRTRTPRERARGEILADLLRSHESVVLKLEELRRLDESGAIADSGSD